MRVIFYMLNCRGAFQTLDILWYLHIRPQCTFKSFLPNHVSIEMYWSHETSQIPRGLRAGVRARRGALRLVFASDSPWRRPVDGICDVVLAAEANPSGISWLTVAYPLVILVIGGFNHLEKYESQREGLSHIVLWKKCLKPPTGRVWYGQLPIYRWSAY